MMGGLKYKLEVHPGETKFLMMQTDVSKGYSYKSQTFANVIWSDDYLRKKCIKEGEKSLRK